jgi:hypothetical protein
VAKLTDKSIHEIIEKRNRLSEPDREAKWRMTSLILTFNDPLKNREELVRYFPIAVVANLEGYFRARLTQLIDSGEPFLSNALKAYPNITIDATLVAAISTKRVTLGELLMHSVSLSSFESLIQVVLNVTGVKEFLRELTQVKPIHLSAKETDRVILDPDVTWRHLGKVFELRHVLCHELAADLQLDEQEIKGLLLTSQQFMAAAALWLDHLEHPDPPLSREERIKQVQATLGRAIRRVEHQVSIFENAPQVSEELLAAVRKSVGKLYEYQQALEEISSAANPFSEFPPPLEGHVDAVIADYLDKLSSLLKLSAMFSGLDWTGRDEHEE